MGPIFIKDTQKYGRGMYATRDIKTGELIEESPVIVIAKKEWEEHLQKTILFHYCFHWGEYPDYAAIILGYGSIFNHSYTPNATFQNNEGNLSMDFYAITDIKKGEEITINYNGDPKDKSPLWFNVIE